MRSKIFKVLSGALLLFLSPFPILAVFGAVYIVFQMVNGMGFSEGFNSFMALLQSLRPYFPYLTTIPVVMILVSILLKNRSRLNKIARESSGAE